MLSVWLAFLPASCERQPGPVPPGASDAGPTATRPPDPAQLPLPDFEALYAKTHRSVVNIAATHALPVPEDKSPRRQQALWRTMARSLGAGFALGPPGQIVTCASVVEDADDIEVVLANGKNLAVEVIASDESTDLALLAVDPAQAPAPLEIAQADSLRVGDWVAAFGTPFGLSHSITAGIVSAIRSREDLQASQGLIISDAAIHPGNNGGPLLDVEGRVVGINLVRGPPEQRWGLALPIGDALEVIESLRQGHAPRHAWLGISVQSIDAALANSLGLSGKQGALVTWVVPDGPAARAGLRIGDVVLALGRTPIADPLALIEAAKRTPIGPALPIRISRNGRSKTLRIRPSAAPPDRRP